MTYNVIDALCQNLSRPIFAKMLCLSGAFLIILQLVSGIINMYELEHYQIRAALSSRNNAINQALDPKNALSQSLFGEYVPKSLNDVSIKKSMLNVQVVGILFANDENESQVMLKMTNGDERIFHVGDSLPGQAMIKRITADGVLVERNGVLESLSLPKNELIFAPQALPLE